jgi:hypothetical protein
MPLNHQNATANLRIDGLAICCFNQKEGLWEVGYMRHPEHELLLNLGDGKPLPIPVDARVIRIETENGARPDYGKEFPNGFFDFGPIPDRKRDRFSLTPDEKENFRWAMNLDEGADVPHGTITLKPPPYPVTMCYISDALLYTLEITPENMFLLPLADDPNMMSARSLDQRLYGKTADEIGVDITCAAGGRIRITIDDKEVASLEHRDGQPWAISLMNMRVGHNHHGGNGNGHMHQAEVAAVAAFEQGDFQIYYDSLDVTGDKFSLWGRISEIMSGRTDCNTPWIGGDGLDDMTSG